MSDTLLDGLGRHVSASLPWMSWNLLLALMPWALAVWAFREGQPMHRATLVAAALSVAFLPNAAYVLTDVGGVHRFNGWDLALRPDEIASAVLGAFTRSLPVAGMVLTFLVLVVGDATLRAVFRGIEGHVASLRVRVAR